MQEPVELVVLEELEELEVLVLQEEQHVAQKLAKVEPEVDPH